jgi:hypothetical protein
LAILGTAVIRIRLLEVPFERDEGEYAYMGKLLLDGIPPYLKAYNLKLPGTLSVYALSMSIFGESIAGVRIGLVLINGATTMLMFLLGQRLLGLLPGLATAVAFACLSLSTGMLAIFAHATHFVLLPAVAGLLVFFKALEARRSVLFFASGLLFGLAVLMKQPGAVFPAFAVFWLAHSHLRGRGMVLRKLIREECYLVLGTLTPIALTIIALAFAGVYERFFFWVFQYGFYYGTRVTWASGFALLRVTAASFLPQGVFFWGLAALGFIMLPIRRFEIPQPLLLFALAVLSFVGVSAGLHYRPHYFILALPATCLLAGAAFRGLLHITENTSVRKAVPFALLSFLVVGSIQAIYSQRNLLFSLPPAAVSRSIYGSNPFPESVEIARYIRDRTHPSDTIAVLGSEPQIYFYSGRHSATGHIYMYGLMEPHPFARQMQEELIREIEAASPAFIVTVSVPTSWLVGPHSPRLLFEWANAYLPSQYDIVGRIVIGGTNSTAYLWDEDARRSLSGEMPHVLVWRRKEAGNRKAVSDLTLDKTILTEAAKGKFYAPPAAGPA